MNDIRRNVGGIAAYLLGEYKDFSFGVEIISALDHFHPGEMAYAYNRDETAMKTKPMAWNLEMAYRPFEKWKFPCGMKRVTICMALRPALQLGWAYPGNCFEVPAFP